MKILEATTPEEKRELAAYLEKHKPEALECLKYAAKAFGPLVTVKISIEEQDDE